jgi:hypothetical protein
MSPPIAALRLDTMLVEIRESAQPNATNMLKRVVAISESQDLQYCVGLLVL